LIKGQAKILELLHRHGASKLKLQRFFINMEQAKTLELA
jgi:hypothetical protein